MHIVRTIISKELAMAQNAQNPKDEKNRNVDDSDEKVQEELRRETGEGQDLKGDVTQNRNLTGSSTWTTLPDSPKKKT
ncbi:MAG: hypothetical protein ACREMS_11335 [Gemmatimonadaceae bacterium]